MKKVLLLLLGLLAIGIIAYFCFQNKVDTIKSSLETSATNTLQSHNIKDIKAKLVGHGFESTSIMRLDGKVNTQEQKDEAGRLVASITGITDVDNQLQVISPIKATSVSPTTIEDKLDNTIKKLKESETAPIPQPEPEKETPKIETISPYIATIQKDKNRHVVLDGYIESKEAKEKVIQKATELFGASNITDNLKIAAGQPESWSEVIEIGLDKLNNVDYGELNLHDANYAFNGFISSDDALKAKQEFLENANQDMSNYSNYLGGFEITIPEKEPIKVTKAQPETVEKPEVAQVEKPQQNEKVTKSSKACQKELKDILSTRKILFDYNKATIKKSSTPLLDEIVNILKTCDLNKIKVVEIGGHTDSIGSYGYNKALSQRRADSVKSYIEKHGIDSSKLKAIGYGERHPIVSNMLKAGRAKNRRIEFIIKEDK